MKRYIIILVTGILLSNCTPKKEEPIKITPEELHNSIDKVIDIMMKWILYLVLIHDYRL